MDLLTIKTEVRTINFYLRIDKYCFWVLKIKWSQSDRSKWFVSRHVLVICTSWHDSLDFYFELLSNNLKSRTVLHLITVNNVTQLFCSAPWFPEIFLQNSKCCFEFFDAKIATLWYNRGRAEPNQAVSVINSAQGVYCPISWDQLMKIVYFWA